MTEGPITGGSVMFTHNYSWAVSREDVFLVLGGVLAFTCCKRKWHTVNIF